MGDIGRPPTFPRRGSRRRRRRGRRELGNSGAKPPAASQGVRGAKQDGRPPGNATQPPGERHPPEAAATTAGQRHDAGHSQRFTDEGSGD